MASHWRDKSRHLEVQMHAGNGRYEQQQHAPVSTVLYGNLRAEIISNRGTRIQRVGFRQSDADLLSPRQPEETQKPLMVGRERQIADAVAAIRAGRPAGFYAACGYGKTTLLRTIAATGAERGLAPSCIYLRAHGDRVGDLLQDLVDRLYICDQRVKLTPSECARLLGQDPGEHDVIHGPAGAGLRRELVRFLGKAVAGSHEEASLSLAERT